MKLVRHKVMNEPREWLYNKCSDNEIIIEAWEDVFSDIWVYCEARLGIDHAFFGKSIVGWIEGVR